MSDDFQGWKNYESWNVALWLQNNEGLYTFARQFISYEKLRVTLEQLGFTETPDKVSLDDDCLDRDVLDEMLESDNAD